MGKVCKKCGYERKPDDFAPDYECPKCGAVYAKVEAYLKRKEEKARAAEAVVAENRRREQEKQQKLRAQERLRQERENAKWGLSPSKYAQIRGNEVLIDASSVEEAKLALKELKLKKKEFGLLKRSVADKQKQIRAEYTNDVRSRGSMMRGGGGLGKVVRAVQRASRDDKRAALARALAPLEEKKQEIEAMIRAIDSAILQVESALIQHEG